MQVKSAVDRRSVPMQRYLDLGARAHVDLLHSHIKPDSRAGVYYLAHTAFGGFEPLGTHPKRMALEIAEQYEAGNDALYVSQQAGIQYRRHCIENVAFLSSCYVDIDHYHTEHKHLAFDELLALISRDLPDLPLPTLGGSSGRGYQLVWTFTNGKPISLLAGWQQLEDTLVKALAPYGGDPKARDAARVLRVSGTRNQNNGARASLRQIGEPVSFEALQRWGNTYRRSQRPVQRPKAPVTKRKANTTALPTRNGYTLAYARMQDYRTLARLRGGRLTDKRRQAIFLFAASAAWFCTCEDSLRAEVADFVATCIAEPDRYQRLSIDAVVKRMTLGRNGETIQWLGGEVDPRYRLRNKTIIDRLEITPAEQEAMNTTIGADEKRRRNKHRMSNKRRSNGVKPLADHNHTQADKRAERASKAAQMRSEGMSVSQIAKALGVSKRSVYGYFKTA